jgi:type VI secretion system protein ImpG
MDRRLLSYYNRELQHLRGVAGEFAQEFPKVASRLSLDEFSCADPYVERLLEGFAFLAARVHLKLDAEFPEFTQEILETVYPHYLAPTPSMAVVQLQPDLVQGDLAGGFEIPRGTTLRSIAGRDDRTACEYRTGHPLVLWPIEVVEAEYCTRELGTLGLPASAASAKAGIRIRLQTGPNQSFSELSADELTFFIRGSEQIPVQIYEQIMGHTGRIVVQPSEKPRPWQHVLPRDSIARVGFEDDEALLPVSARSFQGYRLLHEYFAFPPRFLFFRIAGLQRSLQRCTGSQIDIIILLDQEDLELEGQIEASNLALHCTPVINLFPKRTDRIHLSDKYSEFHVVPDRTRPLDFEVYRILSVLGYGVRADDEQPFSPFYSASDFDGDVDSGAYFTVSRTPRLMSSREKLRGRRSSYGGSEVYVSLVDSKAAPYRSDLRQLGIETLCTNRDLPLQMGVGRGETDFTLDVSAPVVAVRCLSGPTPPHPSYAQGKTNWRIINHLCLNYLSLVDSPDGKGAAALRDLLKLYGNANDPQIRKQIEGVMSVSSAPITRRIKTRGPIAFARGLEIALTFDEDAFEGTGEFLLGAVFEVFFSKYVSINSFTETVIKTKQRGEIMRWPTRAGIRHTL